MTLYLITKLLHIFFVISWMAGLFYLPRLFVYHTTVDHHSQASDIFCVMERRLYKIILMPAMLFTLATGIILAMIPDIVGWDSGWFHLKLLGVVSLIVYHIQLNRWRVAFKEGLRPHSTRFFRIINEVPSLILLIILICVILKPF